MGTSTAPPDLTLQLPRDTLYHVLHSLRPAVPPVSDTPHDIERRDNFIIDQIASFLPANAEEIALAAQFVLANAAATACQQHALHYPQDTKQFLRCQERCDSLLRRAAAIRSLLLRVQAARQKHVLVSLMAEALGRQPPAPPTEPAAEPEPLSVPAPPGDRFADLTEEERYAVMHARRAAEIRAHRGLPPKLTFPPPEPELVRAIVASTSPILLALDPPAAAAE